MSEEVADQILNAINSTGIGPELKTMMGGWNEYTLKSMSVDARLINLHDLVHTLISMLITAHAQPESIFDVTELRPKIAEFADDITVFMESAAGFMDALTSKLDRLMQGGQLQEIHDLAELKQREDEEA